MEEYLQGRKGQKEGLDCDRKPENLRCTSVERHVSLLPEAREITPLGTENCFTGS